MGTAYNTISPSKYKVSVKICWIEKSTHENMPELVPDYKIHIPIKWKRLHYIAAHNELNNILD